MSTSSDDEINPCISLLPQYDAVHNNSDDLPAPNDVGDPNFLRHHVKSLNADILIRLLPSEGLAFQLWPASSTFLSLLDAYRLSPSTSPLHSSFRRRGRRIRILELGSGTGLVGIAAAAILGADVTVTDLAHVIDNLNFNVTENLGLISSGGGEVNAAELSWGNVEQMAAIGREYDVIVGSDIVYHEHLYEPLLKTLEYFLVKGERNELEEGMVFVMAHLKRWTKEKTFFKKAKKLFHVKVIHQDPPSDGNRVGVIVYRFAAGKQLQGSGSGSSNLAMVHVQVQAQVVGSPELKEDSVGL